MLIKLTSAASGKVMLVNARDIHRVSEPQTPSDPAEASRYSQSRSVLEYNRPHPKPQPGREFAFDFVRETPEQIAAMMDL